MLKRTKLRAPTSLLMKAVIFSDDPHFALYAESILARVGNQANVNVDWITKPWPLNLLNDPALAQNALVEALDAHLILFSDLQAQSLPSWAFDWLSLWAAARTIQDAAVGIIKNKHITRGTSAFLALSKLAQDHRLTFIVDGEFTAENLVKLPVRFPPERIFASHLAQSDPVILAPPCSHRSFGINE